MPPLRHLLTLIPIPMLVSKEVYYDKENFLEKGKKSLLEILANKCGVMHSGEVDNREMRLVTLYGVDG
jgi:hypothetical protein